MYLNLYATLSLQLNILRTLYALKIKIYFYRNMYNFKKKEYLLLFV